MDVPIFTKNMDVPIFTHKCLQNGLNGIGIPDLIIAQNAKQNHAEIYSLDNHFRLMQDILHLQVF